MYTTYLLFNMFVFLLYLQLFSDKDLFHLFCLVCWKKTPYIVIHRDAYYYAGIHIYETCTRKRVRRRLLTYENVNSVRARRIIYGVCGHTFFGR